MPKMTEKHQRGEVTFQSIVPLLVLKWCEKKDKFGGIHQTDILISSMDSVCETIKSYKKL